MTIKVGSTITRLDSADRYPIVELQDVGSFEPPQDGYMYARKDGQWVRVVISEVVEGVVEEAPEDNKRYARQNGKWSSFSIPANLGEAPEDGKKYCRSNKEWVVVPTTNLNPLTGRVTTLEETVSALTARIEALEAAATK